MLERVARNARLNLSPEEKVRFLPQLVDVLAIFDELAELDVSSAEPAFTPVVQKNVFREDRVRESWSNETALSMTPHKKEPYFIGPRVVD